MTKELILYNVFNRLDSVETPVDAWPFGSNDFLSKETLVPEVLFVTSYPPRECGIATYSQDLMNALKNQFESSFDCSVCALEKGKASYEYQIAPKFILNTDDKNSFVKTAFRINNDDQIKLVVIQHEFGFFVKNETEFKQFYIEIKKPIVFVFHTILPKPNNELSIKVREMADVASSIIVMTNDAANILLVEYNIPKSKIIVIPHGTHLVEPIERIKLKEKYELQDRLLLSTFGLLGPSKSIETSLYALSAVIKHYPNVLFLILGKTHPSLFLEEGEKYRTQLEALVVELNLTEHVSFVNEYLPLPKLLEYLQMSDIYLFTSNDPNQAVSGTFSYAVSCGCPIISTPIPHAKEVLSGKNGIVFDFGNSQQLSDSIYVLLKNKDLRAEISSNSFHKMASTAWQNSAIAHTSLFHELTNKDIKLNYRNPPINLHHVKKMTTEFGIIQFSKISIPDIHTGYTLDDNARALIAICQHFELKQDLNDLHLIKIYIDFIRHCLQFDGFFLNYVNERKYFTLQNYRENLDDSNGRAIWALGYVSSLKAILPAHFIAEVDAMLAIAIPNLHRIHSTRAMAFIIKGLHYYNAKKHHNLIILFANRLAQMYKHERANDWFWFESYFTYANSLLPEAMLCAYQSTGIEEFKTIAKESFDFLISQIFIDNHIKVVTNKGWHMKGQAKNTEVGGEQPIDIAYTVIALEKFFSVFKEDHYAEKATIAFKWFLGDNYLSQIIYNPCTGGCYDGIEQLNVNLNQGAESTVSYLMARLSIERMTHKGKKQVDKSNGVLTNV